MVSSQWNNPVILGDDPTEPMQASTKNYVDVSINTRVALDGSNIPANSVWPLSISGGAAQASRLASAVQVSLSGPVKSTAVGFDGSGPLVLATSIDPNALNINMVAGLQTTLDNKAPAADTLTLRSAPLDAATHLDTMFTSGLFVQTNTANAVVSNGYPMAGVTGLLQVVSRGAGGLVWQEYQGAYNQPVWRRGYYNGVWTSWIQVHDSSTFNPASKLDATATATAATKLAATRNFSLSGIVTAVPVAFDGSDNVILATAIADNAIPVEKIAGLAEFIASAATLNNTDLTGVPTADTAAEGTNTRQLATTEFVVREIATNAPTKTGGGASGTWPISITGNAAAATTATRLTNARTIALAGPVTGSVAFDGSANVSINTTIADAALTIAKTSGLQAALDAKAPLSGPALTGVPTAPTAAVGTNTTQLATTAFAVSEIGSRAPTKTGSGASGTWPISITGTAANATLADTATVATSASTAAKLTTARTIALSGGATGTATAFDGSANITIPITGLNAANLNAGTVPNGRLSGRYTGLGIQMGIGQVIESVPSTGSAVAGRKSFGLAHYQNSAATVTGAIAFIGAKPVASTMHVLHIHGYSSTDPAAIYDILLYVEWRESSTSWRSLRKVSRGNTDILVTVARTAGGNLVVLVGDTSTTWVSPQLSVEALAGYVGIQDDYLVGWTTELVTSTANYTNLSAAATASGIAGDLQGIASSASRWTTARTLSLTGGAVGSASVDGSANVALNVTSLDATKLTGVVGSSVLTGTYSNAVMLASTNTSGFGRLPTTGSSAQSTARDSMMSAFYKGPNVMTNTGYVVVRTTSPPAATSTMYRIRVRGQVFLASGSLLDMVLHIYRSGPNAWDQNICGKVVLGNVDVPVKAGYDSAGRFCLVFGTASTSWPYIALSLDVMANFGAIDNTVLYDWTGGLTTDISDITDISPDLILRPGAGSISGNAATASKLENARSITLTGPVTGSVAFDGSANVNITTAVADNSLTVAKTNGLWDVLNSKADLIRTMSLKGDLLDAEDLNTYNASGFWVQRSNVRASNGSNYPIAHAGFLYVFSNGIDYWVQEYVTIYGVRYHRVRQTDGAWTAWVRLWDSAGFDPDNKLDAKATAVAATKLATARTMTLNGVVTSPNYTFDGSGNLAFNTSIAANALSIAMTNGLQAALDSKPAATALNASYLTAGTVPNARLSGLYTGVSLRLDNTNVVFAMPSPGTASTNSRLTFGLAGYSNRTANATGAIVFRSNGSTHSVMTRLRIIGSIHATASTYKRNIIDIDLYFYRANDVISEVVVHQRNSPSLYIPVSVGVDGSSNTCIILGAYNTVWGYPNIHLDGILGYTAYDNHVMGWTSGLATSGTEFTGVVDAIDENTLGTLSQGPDIASGEDLNNYVNTGLFLLNSNTTAANVANTPVNAAGWLEVIGNYANTFVVQRFHHYTSNAFWTRTRYSTAWQPWRQIWTDNTFDPDSKLGVSSTATNASRLALASPQQGAGAAVTSGTIVQRDGSGDITARLFRSTYAADGAGISIPYMTYQKGVGAGADNYQRPVVMAGVMNELAGLGYNGVFSLGPAATIAMGSGVGQKLVLHPSGYELGIQANVHYLRTSVSPGAFLFYSGGSYAASGPGTGGTQIGRLDGTNGFSAIGFNAGYTPTADNSMGCSGWFRSNGATGWFNDTYAGGWHMTDATYVRSYQNKAVTAGDFVIASDITLKTAIRPLPYRGRLEPVTYRLKSNGKAHIGFIADWMLKHYPEVVDVNSDGDGLKKLQYSRITAILSAQLNAVEDRVIALEKSEARESENQVVAAHVDVLKRLQDLEDNVHALKKQNATLKQTLSRTLTATVGASVVAVLALLVAWL